MAIAQHQKALRALKTNQRVQKLNPGDFPDEWVDFSRVRRLDPRTLIAISVKSGQLRYVDTIENIAIRKKDYHDKIKVFVLPFDTLAGRAGQ